MDTKKIFHTVSYLQYPLVLTGGYFALKPYWNDFELNLSDINSCFMFIGLAMSFSTLQDTTKTQYKLAEKIWQSPKKGKAFLAFTFTMILVFLTLGFYGLYFDENEFVTQFSIGLIILSVGFIGALKMMIEMFENHRLDKNPLPDQ